MLCDRRERVRGNRHAYEREQANSGDRRERVVREAVGHERVAARVPEVVPDAEPVLKEELPLEDVCGRVASRRACPEEHRGDRRGDCCGNHSVASYSSRSALRPAEPRQPGRARMLHADRSCLNVTDRGRVGRRRVLRGRTAVKDRPAEIRKHEGTTLSTRTLAGRPRVGTVEALWTRAPERRLNGAPMRAAA